LTPPDAIRSKIISPHVHHECRGDDKLAPLVIDLVGRLRDRVSGGGEQLQFLLAFIGIGLGLVMLVIPGVIIWIWQIVDAYNDWVVFQIWISSFQTGRPNS
jgi:hypothetical protein